MWLAELDLRRVGGENNLGQVLVQNVYARICVRHSQQSANDRVLCHGEVPPRSGVILSAILVLCEGNPPVTGGFPSQRASNPELWWFLCCYPEYVVEQTIELKGFKGFKTPWRSCDENMGYDDGVCVAPRRGNALNVLWRITQCTVTRLYGPRSGY